MKFLIIFGIIFSGSLDCCVESFERSKSILFHGLAQSTVSTSEGTMVGKRDKLFI